MRRSSVQGGSAPPSIASRPLLSLLCLCLAATASPSAMARSGGISGRSGAAGASQCSECHNVTNTSVYNYSLGGPTLVAPSSSNSYTLSLTYVSGTKAARGGFDLKASAGTFTAGTGEKLLNGELVHSAVRAASAAGNVSWAVSYNAPASGSATLNLCALAGYAFGSPELQGCPSKTITVNTAPVAVDDTLTLGRDSDFVVVAVTDNDLNADSGDTLILSAVTTPSAGGQAVIEAGHVNYRPASGFSGTETFDYTIADSLGVTDTGTVTVTVTVASAVQPRFAAHADFAIGGGYGSGVAAADLNGDGRADFVVSNPGAATVTVFINNAAGYAATPSFQPGVDFGAGVQPQALVIADLNRDGKPDLAVANYNGSSVSVLRNTTATGASVPTFATQVEFPVQSNPRAILARNFGGDAALDLAVLNQGSRTVTVLLNDTPAGSVSPSFTLVSQVDTGTSPFGLASANFYGDGKPDLAVADGGTDRDVLVLRNATPAAGAPFFDNGLRVEGGHFSIIRALESNDFNQDGKPDLAIIDEGGPSVSVLRNTAAAGADAASFAAKLDFDLPGVSDSPGAAVARDFNGDGAPELAIAVDSGDSVAVLTNATAPAAATTGFLPAQQFAAAHFPYSVSSGDFNGDNQPDLVTTGGFGGGNSASVLLNQTYCVVRLGAATRNVSEGAGTVSLDVQRSGTGCGAASVTAATVDGTARAGSDYTALTQTLDWGANDVSPRTVVVSLGDDALNEFSETFKLVLSNPVGTRLGKIKETAVTVADNDPVPSVSFSLAAKQGAEGTDPSVMLLLSAPSGKEVIVPYATGGTATPVDDFSITQRISPTRIPAGVTAVAIKFHVVADAVAEGAESVQLTIQPPTNATIGATGVFTLTIPAN